QFVCAFAHPNHPLTIFLDDLQWADPASLNLVVDLLAEADTRALLLVGAYRTDEAAPVMQPLIAVLDKLRAGGAVVQEIVLGPLGGGPGARLFSRPPDA